MVYIMVLRTKIETQLVSRWYFSALSSRYDDLNDKTIVNSSRSLVRRLTYDITDSIGPSVKVTICSTERASASAYRHDASKAVFISDHEFDFALDSASDNCLSPPALRLQFYTQLRSWIWNWRRSIELET